MPELSNALNPSHTPWVELTTRLGRLVKALSVTWPQHVKLSLTGPAMKERSRFLVSALMMGCMGGNRVNLVNAKGVGRAAGVEVEVYLCEGVGGVAVVCGDLTVAGTVLGTSPVLTELCGAQLSLVRLSGNMVVAKETSLANAITNISAVDAVSVAVGLYN